MNNKHRHTKVIFTIGPSTIDESIIQNIILEGVDICRVNMAHADHEWARMAIKKVRSACKEVGREIAILMDIKGPEIRTSQIEKDIDLRVGAFIDIISDEKNLKQLDDDIPVIGTNYPNFHHDINVGQVIVVDNGLLRWKVKSIEGERIRCEIENNGTLGSRRHINLPGVYVNLPALTNKDKGDVKIGIEEGINFFALSFVREANAVEILRRYLEENGSKASIIAKIEEQKGIKNLDEIIQASDGIMIARGDLGIECPMEELPIIQHKAVKKCILQGKPVIVATHLLESMIVNPVPTRAEVSDVSTAILQEADCVMLSGETTTGAHPLECIKVINRISNHIESIVEPHLTEDLKLKHPKAKMLRSAAVLAMELEKASILIFTRNKYIPQLLSSLRPNKVPIYAFTDVPHIFKQMLLLWGVEPFLMDFSEDSEITIQRAIDKLKVNKWVYAGDYIVTLTNVFAHDKTIESIQLREVEDDISTYCDLTAD